MHTYEPDLVKQRIRRRLKRRRFWSAGVNDMWCVDQHDKLKKYGLALHTGNSLSLFQFFNKLELTHLYFILQVSIPSLEKLNGLKFGIPIPILAWFSDTIWNVSKEMVVRHWHNNLYIVIFTHSDFPDTCLVTQSDPGPENFCIAKGHSFIWQSLVPLLEGTLQHWYMKDKNNLPPEILWSNLQQNFSPGLEDLLSNPDINYDWHNALE